jgi:hypothetical protein
MTSTYTLQNKPRTQKYQKVCLSTNVHMCQIKHTKRTAAMQVVWSKYTIYTVTVLFLFLFSDLFFLYYVIRVTFVYNLPVLLALQSV